MIDKTSFEMLSFCSINFVYIAHISNEIKFLINDPILLNSKIKNIREPIIKKLKNYPSFIKKIKDYKGWLNKYKLKIIEFEIKQMIKVLDRLIDRYENKSDSPDYKSLYFPDYIESMLSIDLNLIIDKAAKLFIDFNKYLNDKFENVRDIEDLCYKERKRDIEEIYNSYKMIGAKITISKAKKFLRSSCSSFANALIQLEQAYLSLVYTPEKYKSDTQQNIYSFFISCLYLLISAHEKIYFSIAYNEGLECDEKDIDYKIARKFIKEKNKNLYKKLEDTDRKSEIYSAKNWRNAETHRISKFSLKEIEGKLVSVIKEIRRLLNIYKERLEISDEQK